MRCHGLSLPALLTCNPRAPTPVTPVQGRAEQRRVQTYLAVRDWVFSFNVPRLLYNYTPLRLVTGPAKYVPPLPLALSLTATTLPPHTLRSSPVPFFDLVCG